MVSKHEASELSGQIATRSMEAMNSQLGDQKPAIDSQSKAALKPRFVLTLPSCIETISHAECSPARTARPAALLLYERLDCRCCFTALD
ncbi:hypothetical protein PHSY_002606 [Pseudozyma hubeiensis SY62]|uniref:Uncharacterized protein n=1 Tax=Pseudozyma hubeiensis (strain SY62) TaxID=1305764 RepID=R9P1C9_PSEHS|nr:hypothetical protein PHSY_002606 [Pseudozyma hubeiensis SY62]GAC95031.1 hypothetical protein PHSY_002606 [Pseudozyma hubeiensis SY62]